MKAIIVTGPFTENLVDLIDIEHGDFVIGADSGAYLLAKNELRIDLALGDFDSISKEELEYVKEHAYETRIFPEKKDFTDTYLAVQVCIEKGFDEIVIYGGIGNRLDHTYANLELLKLAKITMKNENTEVCVYDPGLYNIENNYEYISFFAMEDVKKLTLEGFNYEVSNYNLSVSNPLCISNEGSGSISFTEGLLLVIKTND